MHFYFYCIIYFFILLFKVSVACILKCSCEHFPFPFFNFLNKFRKNFISKKEKLELSTDFLVFFFFSTLDTWIKIYLCYLHSHHRSLRRRFRYYYCCYYCCCRIELAISECSFRYLQQNWEILRENIYSLSSSSSFLSSIRFSSANYWCLTEF